MSTTQYNFVPVVREGFAANIIGFVADNTQRVQLDVDVNIDKKRLDGVVEPVILQKAIQLYGPGDILTFDPRIVSRTYPEPDVGDFEPNYFPSIEFTDADFPWRFTASAADAGVAEPGDHIGKLTPWLTLVVLVAEALGDEVIPEFEEIKGNESNLPPTIKVKIRNDAPFPLPNLDEAWRWAHVQVTDENILDSDTLKSILKDEPERAISRIICPRRLQPKVKYCAFLVPTFRLGVRAGLGLDLSANVGALKPAWKVDRTERGNDLDGGYMGDDYVRLPYYYRWEFRTGLRGDFEHLVRLLEARKLSGLGIRDIDCSSPGYNIPGVTRVDVEEDKSHFLSLEGALRSLDTKYDCWGRDLCFNIENTDIFTDIEVRQLNMHDIEVRWKTTRELSSLIEYTEDGNAKEPINHAEPKLLHSLTVTGLRLKSRYQFIISGQDDTGQRFETAEGILQMPSAELQVDLANLINMADEGLEDILLSVSETNEIERITVRRLAAERTVEVSFYTEDMSHAQVDYGDTLDYGQQVSDIDGLVSQEHRLEINNILPGTKYFFRITALINGEASAVPVDGVFQVRSFTIEETDIIKNIAVSIEQSSDQGIVNWHTIEDSKTQIEYWQLDEAPVNIQPDSVYRKNHQITLDGLLPGHLYFFKIIAVVRNAPLNQTNEGTFFVPKLPVVTPPIYGRWHNARSSVSDNGQRRWLDHLNLDPRHRVAAGLGVEVIRKQQKALMDSAWDQLGAIDSVNDILRRAQVGRESTHVMHNRMKAMDFEGFLQSSSSMFKRILVHDADKKISVKHYLTNKTHLSKAALDPAFRRISRARGPLRRSQLPRQRDMYSRIAAGELTAAVGVDTLLPIGTQSICDISENIIDSLTPLIQFSATPLWYKNKLYVDLLWKVNNTNRCIASSSDEAIADWKGNISEIGEIRLGPLGASTAFTIECESDFYRSTRTVMVNMPPIVNLRSYTYVLSGDIQPHLEWHSEFADSHQANKGWQGEIEGSGLRQVHVKLEPTDYGIYSDGEGGNAQQSITAAPMPHIGFEKGSGGHKLNIKWKSAYSTHCTASGDWEGERHTSGSITVEPLTTKNFEVICHGSGHDVLSSTTVVTAPLLEFTVKRELQTFKFKWNANTENCLLKIPNKPDAVSPPQGEIDIQLEDRVNIFTFLSKSDYGSVSQTRTISNRSVPFVTLPSVLLKASTFIVEQKGGCAEFNELPELGLGKSILKQNPIIHEGVPFSVYDSENNLNENTRISNIGGKIGLNAGYRTRISVPTCDRVEVTVVYFNNRGVTATAYNKNGDEIVTKSTSDEQSIDHKLVLSIGKNVIDYVDLVCPQNEVLIRSFCYTGNFNAYYALLSWKISNASNYSPSGDWEGHELSGVEGSDIVGPYLNKSELHFGLNCSGLINSASTEVVVKLPPNVHIYPLPMSDNNLKLSWSTFLSKNPIASLDWDGIKDKSGDETLGPIDNKATYALTAIRERCYQQTTTQRVCYDIPKLHMTRSVSSNVSPGLRFAASVYVEDDQTYVKLIWSTSNVDFCKVSWSGQQYPLSGDELIGPVLEATTFDISCKNIAGSATRQIDVVPIILPKPVPVGDEIGTVHFCEDNVSANSAREQLENDPFSGISEAIEIPETVEMVHDVGSVIDSWLNNEDQTSDDREDKDQAFLDNLRTNIDEKLKPDITVVGRTRMRLKLADSLADRFNAEAKGDPLDPIMWAPEFPQPMYEPLRDISHELLLPGVEKIPQNTLGLLTTNRRFVESYLCGMNHEFASELLWREYPTDQRGSYFRQFWDVSEQVPGDEVPEEFKDIKQLHRWSNNTLGNNRADGAPETEAAVLVVRGDLLKRYPGAVIYVVDSLTIGEGDNAKQVPDLSEYGIEEPGEKIKPIFRVNLPPDLTFFGFPFEPNEAKEKFFIIEERVGDVRFGLDTPNGSSDFINWDDLSWDHFGYGVDKGEEYFGVYLDSPPEIKLAEQHSLDWQGASSARRASITMQKPVRIAIHGSQMLIDE